MRTALAFALLVGVATLAGAQGRLADQLRAGIVQEEASQDLAKAIQVYQAIVAQFDEDRKTAATALLRLAECYRKTGQRELAVAAYQRVVREFADQTALVESSRRHLVDTFGLPETPADREAAGVSALRRELTETRRALEAARAREEVREQQSRLPPAGRTTTPVTPETTKLETELLEQRLTDMQRRVEVGIVAPTALRELEAQLLVARERHTQALEAREASEQADRQARLLQQQMLESVEAEIALVDEQVKAFEKRIAAGVVSAQSPELLQLRRELLGLQRKADELRVILKR